MRDTVYTVLEARGRIPVLREECGLTYELAVKPVVAEGYPPSRRLDASDVAVFARLLSDLSEAVPLIRKDVEAQHARVRLFSQA